MILRHKKLLFFEIMYPTAFILLTYIVSIFIDKEQHKTTHVDVGKFPAKQELQYASVPTVDSQLVSHFFNSNFPFDTTHLSIPLGTGT